MAPRDPKPPVRRGLLASRFVKHDLGATFMAVLDVLLVLGLVAAINVAVSRPGCSANQRGDWTAISAEKRVYALAPKTVKFLKGIQKPVQVFVFVAPPGGNSDFMYEDIRELLTRMKSHSRYLSVEYVNIDAEQKRALELIKQHKLSIDRDAFASTELGNAVGGQVLFVSDKRKKSVNFFDTVKYKVRQGRDQDMDARIQAFKGEEMFLNALISVTQRRQPRVCFTSGHEEASPAGYSDLDLAFMVEELKRQNFVTETLQKVSGQIPTRCSILVVAAPKIPLSESAVSAIGAYLDKGGKLLVMPRTLDMEGKTWARTGLEDLLERHGVKLEDAVALDASSAIQVYSVDLTIAPIGWIAEQSWNADHPIGKALAGKRLRIISPRALSKVAREDVETQAVLSTPDSPEAWGERDLYGQVGYDPKRDLKAPVPVVMASKQTESDARLVVMGTWLLVANVKLDPNRPTVDYTKEFLLATFNWLAEKESLVALAPRKPEHVKLELTDKQVNRVGRMVILLLPLFAVMLGLLVWVLPGVQMRRERRQAERRPPPGPPGGAGDAHDGGSR